MSYRKKSGELFDMKWQTSGRSRKVQNYEDLCCPCFSQVSRFIGLIHVWRESKKNPEGRIPQDFIKV